MDSPKHMKMVGQQRLDGKGETMAAPIKSFKEVGVEVSVWQNPKGFSVSLGKRYKDQKTGEWKDSKAFFPEELPVLVVLLQRVQAEIAALKNKA